MSKIHTILTELSDTTKRTEKISILTENSRNETLRRVVLCALDPYQQFYIKKIPEYTPDPQGNSIETFLDNITEFSDRIVTGNAAINRLTELLSGLTPDDAEVATRIIRKDLRCGVASSTANKVWPKFVPTYPCLLARPYNDTSILDISYPAYSQLKADGMRCNIFYTIENNIIVISIRGRSGKFIDLRGHLNDDFVRLGSRQSESVVFDGELVVLEKDGTVMPRKKGNGILNKAIRGKISNDEASRVRMRIWDVISLDKFKTEYDSTDYVDRFQKAESIVGTDTFNNSKYELIYCEIVNSHQEVLESYARAIDANEEGIMVKNLHAPWENKRSPNSVKMKAELECDLQVIGFNPGSIGTKNEGKLGSLICASSDGKVEVSISGFSDELREEIWNNIQEWIGYIVTVKYNERISDTNRPGIDSLFLPRFEELRLDKTEADHSSTIK